jgi:hypothetical protein
MDWIRTGSGRRRYRAIDARPYRGAIPLHPQAAAYCWWAVVDDTGQAVGWLIPGATAQATRGADGEVSCYLGTACGDKNNPIPLAHLGVDRYGVRGGVLTVAKAHEWHTAHPPAEPGSPQGTGRRYRGRLAFPRRLAR